MADLTGVLVGIVNREPKIDRERRGPGGNGSPARAVDRRRGWWNGKVTEIVLAIPKNV